ncbi:MAG: PaaI family thioesterase [Novosphingobium aromaticivorans]|nr:PaaI family thioesterase [Novosphingobium aromaticivorans]
MTPLHHPFVLPPYALAMGMALIEPSEFSERAELAETPQGAPVLTMDFSPRAEGRPGYFHGGAIGGLLEMAGFAALAAELEARGAVQAMKPINISVEFLRNGMPRPVFAQGQVLRAGRRVANVRVEAWHDNRVAPVASCWMNFRLF